MTAVPETPSETRDAPPNRRVCVGVIAGPHGVSGEVKLKPFTDAPESLRNLHGLVLGKAGRPLRISESRTQGGLLIARLEGVETREQAAALKGEQLFVPRDSLPAPSDGEYYHADLIGLRVRDTKGKAIGSVTAVQNFGAGDLLELALDRPRRFAGGSPLVPFERGIVPEIDLERGQITVRIDEWVDSWAGEDRPEEGDDG